MKKDKIIIIVILLLAVILTAVAVTAFLPGQHPAEQPGTTWSTKDGSVTFHVPTEDEPFGTPAYGTITTEAGSFEVAFAMSNLAGVVGVYTPEDYAKIQNGEVAFSIETWTELSINTDRFVVRVNTSTFFHEGQELVFFKEASE